MLLIFNALLFIIKEFLLSLYLELLFVILSVKLRLLCFCRCLFSFLLGCCLLLSCFPLEFARRLLRIIIGLLALALVLRCRLSLELFQCLQLVVFDLLCHHTVGLFRFVAPCVVGWL